MNSIQTGFPPFGHGVCVLSNLVDSGSFQNLSNRGRGKGTRVRFGARECNVLARPGNDSGPREGFGSVRLNIGANIVRKVCVFPSFLFMSLL